MDADIRSKRQRMDTELSVPENFDVIVRELTIAGKDACTYCIDGFTEGSVLQRVIQFLIGLNPEQMPSSADRFLKELIPFNETLLTNDWEKVLVLVYSGMTCLFVDGYEEAILIDCREYPARNVDKPDKDKVLRGSKDSFVETIVFNTALIRRRIRSSELVFELFQKGTSSKTDIAVAYMKGRVEEPFLTTVKKRIQEIPVDSLTMNMESVAECIYHGSWINPFPKFKYSERPDTAAASLLEGNIVIVIDNSPCVMILPNTIFDVIEDADDYYFPPVTGTYLRLSRLVVSILAILITPTYLLFLKYPQWLPEGLHFILLSEAENIPVFWQLMLLEFAVDGLRLASLNTPNMLSTPLSVIAGLAIGEFSVSAGWLNEEILLYMAFVVLANYSQSNYELGYAFKFMRMLLLLGTELLGIYGYVGVLIVTLVCVITNKNVAGKSYLYPRSPLYGRKLLRQFFRVSIRDKMKD